MALTDAFIGLGSNLENPGAQLARAIAELATLPNTKLAAQSPFYRSKPLGPQDQPDFINGCAWLKTSLPPLELLDQLQAIELAHGRERVQHWGPRTLDLDLLLYGNRVIDHPRLHVPHPEPVGAARPLPGQPATAAGTGPESRITAGLARRWPALLPHPYPGITLDTGLKRKTTRVPTEKAEILWL
jgi:2-amino-4-hydroxy-6-hydroxymethyldihydropteridine diphosphokinase